MNYVHSTFNNSRFNVSKNTFRSKLIHFNLLGTQNTLRL